MSKFRQRLPRERQHRPLREMIRRRAVGWDDSGRVNRIWAEEMAEFLAKGLRIPDWAPLIEPGATDE